MPKTINRKVMLFCDHISFKKLQNDCLKHCTQYKIIPVENLTQFLSVSLDFLNKMILPLNLNSVTDSQERLVDDSSNSTYTSGNILDLFNTFNFEEAKSSLSLDEDLSLESLISLYIGGLPRSINYVYYNAACIPDSRCKEVVKLFYLQLIKLHHYLPTYLAFENKSIVNELVTDIFGKQLSNIPHMTGVLLLSAQEISQIAQTLVSVLGVAQLLQRHISIITPLPQDEKKIIIDKITAAPMSHKTVLLNQLLENEYSNLPHFSSLFNTNKLLKVVLSDSNEDKPLACDSDSYSKRKADTLNDLQDVSNKKQKSSSLIYISDHQYAHGVNQYDKDIVNQNSSKTLSAYMFDQQQDVVGDSNEEVTTIGTIDGSNIDYIK